ncbi:hypothetical protein RD792_016517 [Penstemon davidsonii]|uniref:Protein kinase domain-containing protein n=1 Tax=Penstemon davidsonii TaxID=160366 RepID=A0ABR0CJK4_9LAMI|nr:hypothetical protein RD792_016517 [Penstemon davidsonii]
MNAVKMNPNLEPSSNIPVQVPNDNGNAERNAMLFSYRELATATNNFRQESLIGEGGFGAVYKGKLERTGQMVAVKQLNHSGLQGDKEFLVEVLMLSLLRHPNLVHLIGYCAEGEQRLLVYEFMPLGSLEYHLHDLTPDMEPLDWNTRMIIAAGAAKGLDFLHNHADPPVIYRDLKSANILLGEGYHPRLSDFGLAKFGPGKDQSHVSTRVMGTQGYCAPEYAGTGKLTMKSDIYSFGVVLLELITGRRALDMTHGNGKHILVDWARPMLRDRKNFVKLADPRLKGQFSEPILRRAMEVALMCLREDPQLRPGMADVVNALEYFVSQQYDSNDKRSPEGEGQINHDMESFFESKDILQETKLLDKNVDRARAVAEAKMWGELWRDKRQHRTQSDTDEVNR